MTCIYNMNNWLLILIILISLILLFIILAEIESQLGYNFHKVINPNLYVVPGRDESDNLEISKEPENEKYLKSISIGKHRAKQSSIAICCLARNISSIFDDNKQRLEYIGKKFKNYKIILFENDSSDKSRETILKWKQMNPNIILLNCCKLGSCDCKLKKRQGYEIGQLTKERINNMAFYREQYLEYVKENLSHYDYMMVMDFDLDGTINLDGLYNTLSYDNWDAMFINGRISIFGTFGTFTVPYDSMAYVGENSEFVKDTTLLHAISNYVSIINDNYVNSHEYYPVKSAFNGYAIYKIKSILNCSYIGDMACEHNNLAKCMHDNGMKLYMNPLWTGYFNLQGPGGPLTILYDYLTKY